jgi:hypothetical protein
VNAAAEPAPSRQREWWLRTLAIFQSPTAVFTALRDDSAEAAQARQRHVLAYAAAPLVLLLLFVWPIRLAVYGGDVFRSGGGDTGAGDTVFEALALGFGAWSLALLVIGTRAVHGWSPARAIATVVLAGALAALLVAVLLGWQEIR